MIVCVFAGDCEAMVVLVKAREEVNTRFGMTQLCGGLPWNTHHLVCA